MHPQKKERTPAAPDELHSGCKGLTSGVTLGVVGTVTGFLILPPEALGQDLLQNALIVALIFAAMVAGVRFTAIRAFFRRWKTPAGVKKPAVTKSNSGGTAEEERHPLRNGDGIPHAHLWWF